MGRSTMIAALLGVPLASAFAVSGVAHSAFAPASGRLPLAPTHPACSTHARSVLASGAAPTLRGARGGLLGASAVEYSVIKGEETKNGGHKYIFTVTVAGDMSKDSYGEQAQARCKRVCAGAPRPSRAHESRDLDSGRAWLVHSYYHEGFQEERPIPGLQEGHDPALHASEGEAICYSRLLGKDLEHGRQGRGTGMCTYITALTRLCEGASVWVWANVFVPVLRDQSSPRVVFWVQGR